ncbi:MAG: carbohydrate ABC transporter permease, partial [Pseudomonadota bacterium]
MTGKQQKQLTNALQVVLILIAAFVMIIPIIWIFLAAFKTHVDVYQLKIFFQPTFENFGLVFDSPYDLGEKLFNSTIIAFVTVLFAIPIATLAAYSFS